MKKLPILLSAILLATFNTSIYAAQTTPEYTDQEQSIQTERIQRININHADVDELSKLKGVGVTKAQAIIAYREENGSYQSIEDLLKVKGIGEKLLMANRQQLTM